MLDENTENNEQAVVVADSDITDGSEAFQASIGGGDDIRAGDYAFESAEDALDYMLRNFATVKKGNKFYVAPYDAEAGNILWPAGEKLDAVLTEDQVWARIHKDQTYEIQPESEKGTPKTGYATKLFMSSPKRRHYANAVMTPTSGALPDIEEPGEGSFSKSVVQLWRGLSVDLEEFGVGVDENGVSLHPHVVEFADHIKEVLCSGNQQYYDYFLWLIAQAVWEPDVLPRVAIWLHGPSGVGKSMVGFTLVKLFGVHGTQGDTGDVFEDTFNGNLFGVKFYMIDDMAVSKNQKDVKKMQTAITMSQCEYNFKGVNKFTGKNYMFLFICSNPPNEPPLESSGGGERRYLMPKVLPDEEISEEVEQRIFRIAERAEQLDKDEKDWTDDSKNYLASLAKWLEQYRTRETLSAKMRHLVRNDTEKNAKEDSDAYASCGLTTTLLDGYEQGGQLFMREQSGEEQVMVKFKWPRATRANPCFIPKTKERMFDLFQGAPKAIDSARTAARKLASMVQSHHKANGRYFGNAGKSYRKLIIRFGGRVWEYCDKHVGNIPTLDYAAYWLCRRAKLGEAEYKDIIEKASEATGHEIEPVISFDEFKEFDDLLFADAETDKFTFEGAPEDPC